MKISVTLWITQKSSNVREFHSFHFNHIKHDIFIFQMSDKRFPSQFLQPNRGILLLKASPIEPQTSERLHSTKHTQHHNGEVVHCFPTACSTTFYLSSSVSALILTNHLDEKILVNSGV